MNNYDRAFDLIGISRSGGGFGLSGGASGEAPYNPYRMWVDKGNIEENSSLGVSQQLKKQGQIEAKAREEYEREQRKQWDEAHKNEKSGSFSDAEKQQRDADVKEKMKEYDSDVKENDSDLTLQEETIKRIRPDLSSAEAANERRAAERKKQREDAALAAAHSYLEGIDDGHGEPDLSSGGTAPAKKKQSSSGDTNKVAKEALEKTAPPKEVSAVEMERPVVVEPDNFEMKDGAELLTYETDGAIYAFYAYNEDEFGQVVIPTDITDLIGYGYYGDYLLNVGEGGAITLAEHTEVDEVPDPTEPWSMLFGYEYEGEYSWIEKRSLAPWGVMCVGNDGVGYEPSTAEPGNEGMVLQSTGATSEPLFSYLDITDLVANGFDGEYVVNVAGGKVGLSSLPLDDVGLEVVTPEDLVMYNDSDVLYGIGYAFYAYDGENFGQTTIPPPSDYQGQMLFGADQGTDPGRWVAETPTPGSLMFINYDYRPAWIPTPLASGNVLKTTGGTGNPVFDYLYVQELLSTGGSGSFIVSVDVDGSVSLTEHTEADEVPDPTKPWSMLFGYEYEGEYSWIEKRSLAPWGVMCVGNDGVGYEPSTAEPGNEGMVLQSTGATSEPLFSYLDITDLVANGFDGEYVVNVAGGKVGLSSLPLDDVGLEVVTPEDLVMYNDSDVLYGIGYAFYAYDGENFGQTTIPPPSDSQGQMLFGAYQATNPGEWVKETPTPGSLMFINYAYRPAWIPTPLASGNVLKTAGGTSDPVFDYLYVQELLSTGGSGSFIVSVDVDGSVSLTEHTEVDEVPDPTMPWSMLFGEYIDGVGYHWDEKRSGAPFGVWCIGYEGDEYHPFTAYGSAGLVLTSQGEDAPPLFSYLDITDLVASGFDGEYVVNVAGGKVGLSSLPDDDVGLEVVTPEDLVMYNDADVLYGIGYAFYAYDGENFGQTTIPPPSDYQGQMLFGADQGTDPGRWVAETPTPGSLMFINYDYSDPVWIPTPLASGNVLKTAGGTSDPVFDYLYVQELLSTGGSGSFIVSVDVDGSVSLTEHTEVDEVPPSARRWDLLFGADQATNPGEWVTETPTPGSLMFINYASAPAWIPTPLASGSVLKTIGGTGNPVFDYLYVQELLSIGGSGSFIVSVDVDGSVSLTEHTEADEVPPSARRWDLLFGADQSTNPGEWAAWYASTYGLMWFNYDAASGSYNPALIGQAASGKALVSTGVNTAPAFRYLYGSDIYDISSYTGDSLPEGNEGDMLYNDGSDWVALDTPADPSMLVSYNGSPVWLTAEYNYQVPYRYNSGIVFGDMRAT